MKLWVLGSGSAGNAVLVECGGSRVLVDAGFGTRELAGRLRSIGVAPESIEACVVTHEHSDHIKGAASGAKRWGWTLLASAETIAAWPELRDATCVAVQPGDSMSLARLRVTAYATPHDAASPIGVRLSCLESGVSAAVCTDVGHVSASVRALCAGADLLVLESNHDEQRLRTSAYPPFVQSRIASRSGHLSNRESSQLIRDVVHRDLAHVVLAHLSETCNDHRLAHGLTADRLRGTRFRGALSVAMQHRVVGPFSPRSGRGAMEAQYSMAL
ncbi:MAG: MBL fold metallo-hydrolase [Gemmatimonadaceae bacterium]